MSWNERADQMPPLKMLHTADCHLGLDWDPPRAAEAFEALIDVALERQVDCMVIAGDFFDHGRIQQDTINFAAAQLNRLKVPCVVLPGNHDPMDAGSLYRRYDLEEMCPSVRVLTDPEGTFAVFPALNLSVWGRPTVDHHPAFRPLADMPPRRSGYWNVAIAHGLHVPYGEITTGSSPISAGEIAAGGWDYVALGHVDDFMDVSCDSAIAYYSGSPLSLGGDGSRIGEAALVSFDASAGITVEHLTIPVPRQR